MFKNAVELLLSPLYNHHVSMLTTNKNQIIEYFTIKSSIKPISNVVLTLQIIQQSRWIHASG